MKLAVVCSRGSEQLKSKSVSQSLNSGIIRRIAIVLSLLFFLDAGGILTSGSAIAQSFTFRKIADTTTPIPGGSGTFTSLGSWSLDHGHLAFKVSAKGR